MRNFISIVLIMLFGAWSASAYDGYEVTFNQEANAYQLEFSLGDISVTEVTIDGQTYSVINFEGSVTSMKTGFAELPFIHAAVMLEADNNVDLIFNGGNYEDIQLAYPLLPSRGVIYRDQDPASIPYVIDPKSITDTWYPGDLANNTEPYILRDVRGTNVYVYPFQYNAQRNVLRVYNTVEVSLLNNNTSTINPLSAHSSIVYEMDAIYASIFINYEQSRDALTIGEMGDILVLVTDRDEAAMDPYIQWKREKGYNVTKEVVSTGTNIVSNVQAAYASNNNLLYVQLVGDWADIKCNTLNGGSPPMDPQVGCVAGGDDVPDICVGRFSAENPTHVTTQVDKAINFEKYPEMGGTWYKTATGIGSTEGPGDDNEKDFEHLDVIFNDKLDMFTYDTYNPIYEPSGSIADVNAAVNGGTSMINYCGHGSPTSWGTTGFSNSNVNSLSNGDKLPFIISVACNNGDFHTGTCFAEAWQRKVGGGSVMFLGASISQPWDPPMRGEDYFSDIYTGGYDYSAHAGQNGINTTEGRTTLGAIVFNGLVLMTTESSGSSDWETAKTWNLFGDAAMQARSDVPAELVLSNNAVMVGIPFATTITSGGNPVEGAMVTISQDENYFTAISDATGSVSITHSLVPGDALLVVTGFNTETIYETVAVIPSSGAYVMYAAHSVNDADGNGNGMLDYGENIMLSISMENVGSADASNVEVILSSDDEYVTITDNNASYGSILAGQTVTVDDGFAITIHQDIPDGHAIMFSVETTGDDMWNSAFSDMGHAPVLVYGTYSIDDATGNGNGKLDPGETVDLTITVNNDGSSDAYAVVSLLSTNSTYVEIPQPGMTYGDIAAGGTADQVYTITTPSGTPAGHNAEFIQNLTANMGISGEGEFSIIVGQIPVLVIDLDGNNNSADVMMGCFDNLSVTAETVTSVPVNLELYSSVFVCLGIYPDNTTLSAINGQRLADYLDAGGKVYMEGGDTWYYDPATPAHAKFNITGLEDGSSDLGTLVGQAGTFTEDLTYAHIGENSYIDHIAPVGDAFTIFKNQSPSYNTAVAYDEGSYKTIGSSFEFGGLGSGPSNVDYLMHQYLNFFGIDAVWVGIEEDGLSNVTFSGAYPNPFSSETNIAFTLVEEMNISMDVYNMNGQKVSSLTNSNYAAGSHVLRWNAEADGASEGLYFIRMQTEEEVITRKVVFMH